MNEDQHLNYDTFLTIFQEACDTFGLPLTQTPFNTLIYFLSGSQTTTNKDVVSDTHLWSDLFKFNVGDITFHYSITKRVYGVLSTLMSAYHNDVSLTQDAIVATIHAQSILSNGGDVETLKHIVVFNNTDIIALETFIFNPSFRERMETEFTGVSGDISSYKVKQVSDTLYKMLGDATRFIHLGSQYKAVCLTDELIPALRYFTCLLYFNTYMTANILPTEMLIAPELATGFIYRVLNWHIKIAPFLLPLFRLDALEEKK